MNRLSPLGRMSLRVLRMTKERIFTVRFNECVFYLKWPVFFFKWRYKATLKKILGWLFMHDYENRETIEFLESEMPGLQELVYEQTAENVLKLEKEWHYQEAAFEKDFRDPDPSKFPAEWSKDAKRDERDRRKRFNSNLKKGIAQAKKEFESAQKQARKDRDHAREAYDLYLEARGDYRAGV